MNCTEFRALLDRFVAGDLASDLHARAEEHLLGCEACMAVWMESAGEEMGLAFADSQKLTREILEAVELDACTECEALLCDYLDGTLASPERALVGEHLEGCAQCSELAVSLQSLEVNLAALAEMKAPPGVVELVMARTIAVQRRPDRGRPWSLVELTTLVRRPRFPLEAAFACTVVWMTLFGMPSAMSISGTLEASTATSQVELRRALGSMQTSMRRGVTGVRHSMVQGVDSLGEFSSKGLEEAAEVSTEAGERVRRSVRRLMNRGASAPRTDQESG